MKNHIINQRRHEKLRTDTTMHVIGVVSNPARFHSRYRIFREWVEHMNQTQHVKLYLVEAAFGDRKFECTEDDNPDHLQLRINSEIWIKENLINLGVRYLLPINWKYMSWVDTDVFFRDPDWALDAIHELQHHPIIQPWSDALDLGPHGNVMQHFKSFGYQYQNGNVDECGNKPYNYAHPGYAWSCTRSFYEQIEKLIDFAIIGSGDWHMAYGFIGGIKHTANKNLAAPYTMKLLEWESRAVRLTHRNVGYIPGRIEHHFHGPKNRRYYVDRWKILTDNSFNPYNDLRYDEQGILTLFEKPELEKAIRLYNRSRCEDSIEER